MFILKGLLGFWIDNKKLLPGLFLMYILIYIEK